MLGSSYISQFHLSSQISEGPLYNHCILAQIHTLSRDCSDLQDLYFKYYFTSLQTKLSLWQARDDLTFLYQLYVCDGEDALLVSMVTLIPVSINLTSNSQNITLWGGGRAGMRRTTQEIRGGEERKDKTEVVKKKNAWLKVFIWSQEVWDV